MQTYLEWPRIPEWGYVTLPTNYKCRRSSANCGVQRMTQGRASVVHYTWGSWHKNCQTCSLELWETHVLCYTRWYRCVCTILLPLPKAWFLGWSNDWTLGEWKGLCWYLCNSQEALMSSLKFWLCMQSVGAMQWRQVMALASWKLLPHQTRVSY